jgi:glycosyltransferase involved in cell wall biosynthesis
MHAYPLWEQVSIPRLVRAQRIDVLIAPYNTAPLALPARTRLVLVVHDLIFMEPMPFSRSLYQNAGRLYRRWVTPHAVQSADLILTVSEYTKRQLVSRFGVEERRMRVIPVSIGEEWYADPAKPRERATTVLAVAGEAPSKNLFRALEAFALCHGRYGGAALRMKVAGVKPAHQAAFREQARALGIEHGIEFLSYLSDNAMRALYRASDVLLMPSLAEGFGIPLLEAMAAGVPVASSSATSLPEIGGDAPVYFDPLNTEEMAAVLQRVLGDVALRREMSQRGLIQARRFHPNLVRNKIEAFWSEIELAPSPAASRELASC